MKDPQAALSTVPEFRDDLVHVGKAHPKVDAAKMIQAKPSYVEDSIPPGTATIKMLRSPHPHALIKHLDAGGPEKLPGDALLVITHRNCPDVTYTGRSDGSGTLTA